jgi:hypothetical protein
MSRHLLAGLLAVALGGAAGAYADAGRAPVAPRETAPTPTRAPDDKSAGKVKLSGVQWRKHPASDVSASAQIGPEGGVIALRAAGLRLVVPPGEVSGPTRFGSPRAGRIVAYDFEPAGSVFPVALRVEQDPSLLGGKHADLARAIVGYFPDRADLAQTWGTGAVAERIPLTWSTEAITFSAWHFSGYMMSWGLDGEEAPR